MSASNEQRATAAKDLAFDLNDEVVREYLKNNDDFLQRHPDMLDFLHVTHATGSAVSLVEKQVSVLRERNMDMRHRLTALNANARENDRLYDQSSKLVLKLLEAESPQALYDTLLESLRKEVGVEYASMIIFSDSDTQGLRSDSRDSVSEHIGSLFRGHKSVCGTLRQEELGYLFPEANTTDSAAGSAAIAPLVGDQPLGLIAVGSSDADRYNSSVGTLFLTHVAEVIARLLPRLQA